MNQPEAKVLATSGNFATVSVEAAVACARCAAGRGCGAGLLQQGRARQLRVQIAEGLFIAPGDKVTLELAPDHLLRAALLAYGLPLLAMVLAVAAASRLAGSGNDPLVILSGVVGLFGGMLAGRTVLRRGDCLRHMTPVAARRVAASAADT
jgi:sigma-E factor negative regulatory protein RseC